MKTNEVYQTARAFARLCKIERALNRADVAACNGLTEKAQRLNDARGTRLLTRASLIARDLGCTVRHQSDPRGVSLYLVDDEGRECPAYLAPSDSRIGV